MKPSIRYACKAVTLLGTLSLLFVLLCACHKDTPAQAPLVTPSPAPSAQSVQMEVSISTPTVAPTATPVPTEVPTPVPTPTPSGLCGGRFPEAFTEEVVQTETSYQSSNLAIFVEKIHDETTYSTYVTYFVADIYMQDVECLKTAAAGGDFSKGKIGKVKVMASENNALLACSGDYYGYYNRGLVIRNGVYYETKLTNKRESCVLFRDGTVETFTYEQLNIEALLERGAYQGWTFGPALLDGEGNPLSGFTEPISSNNPRCMLGYYEPGHYCVVLVDGRQTKGRYSGGMTLDDLSKLAYSLGCKAAFNLDGGQSAQLYWNEDIYNSPFDGGRSISDIVYFVDTLNPNAPEAEATAAAD